MLFNSLEYFLFLSILYLAYRFLSHRQQNILLLIGSYFFYAWWDIRFLFLIVVSTVINYSCGIMIGNKRITKKEIANVSAWLFLSCFSSIVVPWNHLATPQGGIVPFFDWGSMMSWSIGWKIFFMVCSVALLVSILFSRLLLFDQRKKRIFFLFIGILVNLFILGFFKYYNFFIDNIEWLLNELGLNPTRFHLNIVLPIGISFYIFKGIGYILDVYREEYQAEHNYTNFALFIAFFPALLAGPIDRAGNLLKQISYARKVTIDKTFRGLHLIVFGLFKKVVIADGVFRTVNSVYGSTGHLSWIDVVVATVLFTLQIYCDFSGYTDLARGTAKLFGFDLMINFKLPYFSQNPREFWSRWHISLSTWLRDYLYIPLGGNRHGAVNTYRNLILTMVLGGLWHGAAWNFVMWGLYHGIVLSAHRVVVPKKGVVEAKTNLLLKVIKTGFFFAITCYGWLIFRAQSLEQVIALSSTLIVDFGNLSFGGLRPRFAALFGLPVLLCIEIIENTAGGKSFYNKLRIPIWTSIYAAMIFGLMIGMSTESGQFIYFKF